MSGIVVGIDGSSCSRVALRFAADEAKLRNEPLRVVSVWHVPGIAFAGAGFTPGVDDSVFADAARAAAEEELGDVLGDESDPGASFTLYSGNPAEVLTDVSKDATMLIVGSRGHGGFAGLLLGSVSQQCSAHAHCPLVVVHERSTR